ncbi:MAG TPA: hypothetical protein VGM19_13865 [Armatimonadota bacterium]|jgi:hypothetical protein
MSGGIYLILPGGKHLEMTREGFVDEAFIQKLLEEHHGLLAGDQMNDAAPRRWLLVGRELGVPSEEQGPDRWAVDHLFIDQDGIPTIVEVKQSSDTRIRREVVGQMLDYAANGVVYWPVVRLRERFENTCRCNGAEPEDKLREVVGQDVDPEVFWAEVQQNLQLGKVRLLFVADKIPGELRRIIEFLNERMVPTEVLGIEITRYATEDHQAYVPRVVGQTSPPGRPRASKEWDEISFFAKMHNLGIVDPMVEAAHEIMTWIEARGMRPAWGRGATYGCFGPSVTIGQKKCKPFWVTTGGSVSLFFGSMVVLPPFDGVAKRKELLERLNQIPGWDLPPEAIGKYPNVKLESLTTRANMDLFLETLDWFLSEVQSAAGENQ